MIAGQIFRLQLSAGIIANLAEQGYIKCEDEILDQAIHATAKLLKDGVELPDFSYEFIVTDKDNNEIYTA